MRPNGFISLEERHNYQSSLPNKFFFFFLIRKVSRSGRRPIRARRWKKKILVRVLPWGFADVWSSDASVTWGQRDSGPDDGLLENKRAETWVTAPTKGPPDTFLAWRGHKRRGAQRSEWRLLIGEPKVRKKRRDLVGGGGWGRARGPSSVSFSLDFPLLCWLLKKKKKKEGMGCVHWHTANGD